MEISKHSLFLVVIVLASVLRANADTLIDRRYFTLVLSSGWRVVTENPRIINGDPEDTALIADMGVTLRSRQVTVSIIGTPLSSEMTFEEQLALQHPEPKTVVARGDFAEFAGLKGIGRTTTIQHSFPAYSVQSRFSFERDGCMCSVTWSASAEKAADAARAVERQREDLEKIVKAIVVRVRPSLASPRP